MSFTERVSYQRAIEEIYWRHRIWPKENPETKPSLDAAMSQDQLEKKVQGYLLNSQALEDYYKEPLSAGQLQAEMERMARDTKQPEVLRELFEALGNDPFVIAECLARPLLSERMTAGLHVTQAKTGISRPNMVAAATANYTFPKISDGGNGCIDDTWAPTSITDAPPALQSHTAVWTGSEMIIWGQSDGNSLGGRYSPSTDSWTPISTTGAPDSGGPAVWSGIEMIVYGGSNAGGRYNPSTDSWVAITTTGAPDGRSGPSAVWTGTEMIIWGGFDGLNAVRTGGRYNPNTDSWADTSNANAPSARYAHTAVWTGSEMIVWGGTDGFTDVDTGRSYNPISNTWTATNITNAPSRRHEHTAVWSSTEMIVWGGTSRAGLLNTGGRYDPSTNSWTATSTTNAPSARVRNQAVWTGSEMIVWGGYDVINYLNTGGRYNPTADSWVATKTTDAPVGRENFTAVWTGSEMIVWGGFGDAGYLNTGGRYCAASGPTPTPTPTAERFTLSAQKRRVQGINTVRLIWSGATSANVDVYRNGVVIATTTNDGSYDDSTGDTGQAEYMYMVCEAGAQTCSNEVLVSFPPTGSATWSMNPVSGDWNDPRNWMPNIVPNGAAATATFNVSNITDISLSDAIRVEGIVFDAGASAFTIACPKVLEISGTGITNNSGVTQNFVSTISSQPIKFINSATAGNDTTYTNSNGHIEFDDYARAGSATFVTSNGGNTIFGENATSDTATFITNGGGTTFPHHGGNATFITNPGGTTYFGSDARAENATLIANGSEIIFDAFSHGGTARVELFRNGLLYTADAYELVLGSIEGNGTIELGDYGFKVGGNNLSTVFAGHIRDDFSEINGGRLIKEGSGTLTLTGKNYYKNGTAIYGGALILASERDSSTGPGPVDVRSGTLGGSGAIYGAVTIGTGQGSGAILDPGNDTVPGTLTMQKTLTLHADATCTILINSDTPASDQVTARGIRIRNASILFQNVGTSILPPGTTLTVINNTAATRIKGTFNNLADGSIITIGSNYFQASYEGGNGNDLTLTVVP